MAELPLSGGCLCGAVRYEVTETPGPALYCHCTRCQRRTGAAASAQARIDGSTLRVVEGERFVRGYRPPDGFEKLFCAECGSQLFSRNPDKPTQMSMRLGSLRRGPGRAAELAAVRGLSPPHGSRFRTTACRASREAGAGRPRRSPSSGVRPARSHARHRGPERGAGGDPAAVGSARRRAGPTRADRTAAGTGGRAGGPDRVGPERRRLPRRGRSERGQPEPLAPRPAERRARAVRGARRRLPGARRGHLQHHVRGRREGLGRGRRAHHRGDGPRGARARDRSPGRAADQRRDLHAQPHRPLRRAARPRVRGRPGERPPDHRPRRLPRRRRERERDRRARHGPARGVHVRRPASARPARARGRGHRRDRSARHAGAGGADGVDQPRRARCSRSTA